MPEMPNTIADAPNANSIPQLRAIMLHASTFARAGTALRVRH